jgi:hypothetical protein
VAAVSEQVPPPLSQRPETRVVLSALRRLNPKMPEVAVKLADESLSAEAEHAFADLLIQVGGWLHQHADGQRLPTSGLVVPAPDSS